MLAGFFDLESYAYGIWPAVAVNIAIFIFFVLSFLKPRKRSEWRSMGAFSAFIIALFTEMYGFPLSIYLLTSVLGNRYPVTNPFAHLNGNLWAVFLGGSIYLSALLMLLGGAAILVGLIIMGIAWRQIHRGGSELITSGLYARLRHPQYSGLFLIMSGMLLQWPTIITVVMLPFLVFMYYRLARREETEIENRFGERFVAYRRRTPMFWPRLSLALSELKKKEGLE